MATLAVAASVASFAITSRSKGPAPSSADDIKAFAGDPAKKVQIGAPARDQAIKGAAQAQAAAQATAMATRPRGSR